MAKEKRKDKDEQSVDGLGVSFEQAMNIFAQPIPTDEEIVLNTLKDIEAQFPKFFKRGITIFNYVAIAQGETIGVSETHIYEQLPEDIKHHLQQRLRFY
jgi:hypothetical protein